MKGKISFNLVSHSSCTLCKGNDKNIPCFVGCGCICLAKSGLKN